MIVGKWLYMSPETTTNGQIDHRSDLFSLGVILYLLCSGYMPFTGAEPKEIVKKIRAGQYKPLHEIVQVPEQLALLVARLLAPNPDDRPQAGQEVAAELTDIARQYGIEGSGPSIASFLAQLFPSEAGGAEPPGPTTREIARVFPDEMGSQSTKDSLPTSNTQSSGSTSNRGLPPVDVSQTYRRHTGEMSAQSALDATQQPSDASSLLSRQPGARPDPDAARYNPFSQPATEQIPKLRDGSIIKIAILGAIAVALAIATYLLRSS
jgi:serine/threonine-protein kinase